MKENTYDVPAYKFFIVKIVDGKREHSKNEYTYLLQNNPNQCFLIPFEDVDGLTIHEVKGLLHTSDTSLFGCTAYKNEYGMFQSSAEIAIYVDFKDVNIKEDDTIDKAFEWQIEKIYMEENEQTKRMLRCYFERYQDKSYEKTRQRILSLMMKNKK